RPRTLLDIQIETGRKHQIRRHLAAFGHPIVGDRLYGKATAEPLQLDRKSTRLNSSHVKISYAAFCLKKKNLLGRYITPPPQVQRWAQPALQTPPPSL